MHTYSTHTSFFSCMVYLEINPQTLTEHLLCAGHWSRLWESTMKENGQKSLLL